MFVNKVDIIIGTSTSGPVYIPSLRPFLLGNIGTHVIPFPGSYDMVEIRTLGTATDDTCGERLAVGSKSPLAAKRVSPTKKDDTSN